MVDTNLMTLTAEIVASHVANNSVVAGEVPALITSTYQALAGLDASDAAGEDAPAYAPAVTVRKSLADPNRIVSMIDGKPYSSLKRHLASHGLTPVTYRERYGLKPDYPMVAPGYSAMRSELSLKLGLGRKRPVAATASVPEPAPAPRRRKLKLPNMQESGSEIAGAPRNDGTPEKFGQLE